MDTQTHGSTSKDDCGSTSMNACRSAYTDVSTESMVMHGSTCPYISTKGNGVHRVLSTDDSTVKTVVQGITNVYNKYGR